MKKGKLLAGAIVLSMAMLGTGYALWNDTLDLTTNVKTGVLDIQYTATGTHDTTFENDEINKVAGVDGKLIVDTNKVDTGRVFNQTLTNESVIEDAISFTTTNMKPGDVVVHQVHVVNRGTVTAKYAGWEVVDSELLVAEIGLIEKGATLKPGEEKMITVTVTFPEGEVVDNSTQKIMGYLSGTFTWEQ